MRMDGLQLDTLRLGRLRERLNGKKPLSEPAHYAQRRPVYRGGSSCIYEVRDPQRPDDPFAIKVLHSEYVNDRRSVRQFYREAIATAYIEHPHIVTGLSEAGFIDDRPLFAMELLDGKILRQSLTRMGVIPRTLPWQQIRPIALQLCDALDAVHAAGLVHADVKPDNVMLVKDGNTVKLFDFGCTSEIGEFGGDPVWGTADYMSPEHVHGFGLDAYSDIYSLGVVLYEIFCGSRPFEGSDSRHTLRMHLQEPPQPPQQLNSAISDRVQTLILRALEKDPARRFQNMQEMAEAIKACP